MNSPWILKLHGSRIHHITPIWSQGPTGALWEGGMAFSREHGSAIDSIDVLGIFGVPQLSQLFTSFFMFRDTLKRIQNCFNFSLLWKAFRPISIYVVFFLYTTLILIHLKWNWNMFQLHSTVQDVQSTKEKDDLHWRWAGHKLYNDQVANNMAMIPQLNWKIWFKPKENRR